MKNIIYYFIYKIKFMEEIFNFIGSIRQWKYFDNLEVDVKDLFLYFFIVFKLLNGEGNIRQCNLEISLYCLYNGLQYSY